MCVRNAYGAVIQIMQSLFKELDNGHKALYAGRRSWF